MIDSVLQVVRTVDCGNVVCLLGEDGTYIKFQS